MRGKDDTYQTLLVNQLRAMTGYEEILVPQTAMSPELVEQIEMSGREPNVNDKFSFEQMISFAAGLPAQQAPAEAEAEDVDTAPAAIFRELQSRVDILEKDIDPQRPGRREPASLILARNKIRDYVSDREDRIEVLSRTRTPQGRRREISEEQLIEIAQLEEEIAQFQAAKETNGPK